AKIFDGVFEVGFGVQQAACGPAISHCASRIMPDLHQTPIDLVPCGWIKITLPLHNTAHKPFRNFIMSRIASDQRVEFGAVRSNSSRRTANLERGARE